ncbi:hypothetical protein C8R44DRAFT_743007 [Mycena epipterygia]|nr:hypothetical protein C8R44DRAFT_743007 [Mycena epipterygia]
MAIQPNQNCCAIPEEAPGYYRVYLTFVTLLLRLGMRNVKLRHFDEYLRKLVTSLTKKKLRLEVRRMGEVGGNGATRDKLRTFLVMPPSAAQIGLSIQIFLLQYQVVSKGKICGITEGKQMATPRTMVLAVQVWAYPSN